MRPSFIAGQSNLSVLAARDAVLRWILRQCPTSVRKCCDQLIGTGSWTATCSTVLVLDLCVKAESGIFSLVSKLN